MMLYKNRQRSSDAFPSQIGPPTPLSLPFHLNFKGPSKELFLDTKGLCFLCSKEPDDSTASINRHNGKNENSTTVTTGVEKVNLLSILRYLKIKPSPVLVKLIARSLDEEDDKDDNFLPSSSPPRSEKYDFAVLLCVRCSAVCKTLSLCIRQQEVIEMRKNYKLEEFSKILSTPDSCWKRLEGKMDTTELLLVQRLRKETKDKCFEQLETFKKNSCPKVKVVDCKKPVPTTSKAEQRPKRSFKEKSPIIVDNKQPEEVNVQILFRGSDSPPVLVPHSPYYSVDQLPPPPTFQTEIIQPFFVKNPAAHLQEENSASNFISLQRPLNNANDSDDAMKLLVLSICSGNWKNTDVIGQCECIICQERFPNAIKFSNHLADAHPEILFAHIKVAELSDEDETFNACCQSVLRNNVTIETNPNNHTWDENRKELCMHCGKYPEAGYSLKFHMVLNHYHIYEERVVVSFQQTKSKTQRNNRNRLSTDSTKQLVLDICTANTSRGVMFRGKEFYACCLCKKKFVGEIKTREHLTSQHPYIFFSDAKQNQLLRLSETKFQEICKEVVSSEFRKSQKRLGSITVKNQMLFCSICIKQKCSSGGELKFHMVFERYLDLERKLVSIGKKRMNEEIHSSDRSASFQQITPSFSCTLPARKFSHQRIRAKDKKLDCSKTKSKEVMWKCQMTGCSQEFASRFALDGHSKVCSKIILDNTGYKNNGSRRGAKFIPKPLSRKPKNSNLARQCQENVRMVAAPLEISRATNTADLSRGISLSMNCDNGNARGEKHPDESGKLKEKGLQNVTCRCGMSIGKNRMIECRECAVWYHQACEGIKEIPRWFTCRKCKKESRKVTVYRGGAKH